MFQLPYDGLHSGPDPSALSFTSPEMLRCMMSMVIILIVRSVSVPTLLHFQFFTLCAHNIPPHANAVVEGLVWSHHRSINPALLPSTDYCTIENAGWSALKW